MTTPDRRVAQMHLDSAIEWLEGDEHDLDEVLESLHLAKAVTDYGLRSNEAQQIA